MEKLSEERRNSLEKQVLKTEMIKAMSLMSRQLYAARQCQLKDARGHPLSDISEAIGDIMDASTASSFGDLHPVAAEIRKLREQGKFDVRFENGDSSTPPN